eukprot:scaffold76036_cov56-Phaeocystis_antarctica.AAC.2
MARQCGVCSEAQRHDHRPSRHPAAYGGGGRGGGCGPAPRRRGRLPQRTLLGGGCSGPYQSQVPRPRVVSGGGRAPCGGGRGEGRAAAARGASGRRWPRSRPLPCDDGDYRRAAAAPGMLVLLLISPSPSPNPEPRNLTRAMSPRCSSS